MTEPRLLTRPQAAAYCGYSPGQFSKLVANGTLPGHITKLRRWDRVALDLWLDKLSGIERAPNEEDAFDIWEREHHARKKNAP